MKDIVQLDQTTTLRGIRRKRTLLLVGLALALYLAGYPAYFAYEVDFAFHNGLSDRPLLARVVRPFYAPVSWIARNSDLFQRMMQPQTDRWLNSFGWSPSERDTLWETVAAVRSCQRLGIK